MHMAYEGIICKLGPIFSIHSRIIFDGDIGCGCYSSVLLQKELMECNAMHGFDDVPTNPM